MEDNVDPGQKLLLIFSTDGQLGLSEFSINRLNLLMEIRAIFSNPVKDLEAQTEIMYRIRLLKSLWLVASLITSVNYIDIKENPLLPILSETTYKQDDKIVNSHVSFQEKNSQGNKQINKQKRNAGGNAVPWRDEWILSRPLISWGSHWNFCISTSPATSFYLTSGADHRPQKKLRRRSAEFRVGKPMNYLLHQFS